MQPPSMNKHMMNNGFYPMYLPALFRKMTGIVTSLQTLWLVNFCWSSFNPTSDDKSLLIERSERLTITILTRPKNPETLQGSARFPHSTKFFLNWTLATLLNLPKKCQQLELHSKISCKLRSPKEKTLNRWISLIIIVNIYKSIFLSPLLKLLRFFLLCLYFDRPPIDPRRKGQVLAKATSAMKMNTSFR